MNEAVGIGGVELAERVARLLPRRPVRRVGPPSLVIVLGAREGAGAAPLRDELADEKELHAYHLRWILEAAAIVSH